MRGWQCGTIVVGISSNRAVLVVKEQPSQTRVYRATAAQRCWPASTTSHKHTLANNDNSNYRQHIQQPCRTHKHTTTCVYVLNNTDNTTALLPRSWALPVLFYPLRAAPQPSTAACITHTYLQLCLSHLQHFLHIIKSLCTRTVTPPAYANNSTNSVV